MEFLSSQNRTEASFYIDLKTNLSGSKNVFGSRNDPAFYPAAYKAEDISRIFPEK